jgi:hypothetical protein
MKKITLSVAALSLALNGYTTNPDSTQITNNNLVREITFTAEDMIGWIIEDVANGYITDTVIADTYIDNLLDILSKIEDLDININKVK